MQERTLGVRCFILSQAELLVPPENLLRVELVEIWDQMPQLTLTELMRQQQLLELLSGQFAYVSIPA